ncbi:MAG: hypothetical protein HN341_09840 [Verrucomicrobia bacterium]|nr:hypothetical protein [Verrucomicrobiota bacterium]
MSTIPTASIGTVPIDKGRLNIAGNVQLPRNLRSFDEQVYLDPETTDSITAMPALLVGYRGKAFGLSAGSNGYIGLDIDLPIVDAGPFAMSTSPGLGTFIVTLLLAELSDNSESVAEDFGPLQFTVPLHLSFRRKPQVDHPSSTQDPQLPMIVDLYLFRVSAR